MAFADFRSWKIISFSDFQPQNQDFFTLSIQLKDNKLEVTKFLMKSSAI